MCDIIKGSRGAPIMSLTSVCAVCAPISHFSYHFLFPERLRAQAKLYIFSFFLYSFGFRGFELGTAGRRASENAGHPKDPRLETQKPGQVGSYVGHRLARDYDDGDVMVLMMMGLAVVIMIIMIKPDPVAL